MPDHDEYVVGLDAEHLPDGAKEVLITLGQLQSNRPLDQRCQTGSSPQSHPPLHRRTSTLRIRETQQRHRTHGLGHRRRGLPTPEGRKRRYRLYQLVPTM